MSCFLLGKPFHHPFSFVGLHKVFIEPIEVLKVSLVFNLSSLTRQWTKLVHLELLPFRGSQLFLEGILGCLAIAIVFFLVLGFLKFDLFSIFFRLNFGVFRIYKWGAFWSWTLQIVRDANFYTCLFYERL